MENKKNNFILFPLLLVLYELAVYLTNDAYLPALPAIAYDLATNNNLTQLTLTAWFIGSASLQPILGPVADRYGRRCVLLIGGVVFIIATLVCATPNNIVVLLGARFFQGATIPSMITAGYATIHELFEHKRAISTLAWMFSITVLAPAFGPLFGAIILEFVNWRWIFGVLAIWGIITLIAMFFKMPETSPYQHKNPIKLNAIILQYKNILLNRAYVRAALSYCFLFGALIAWITAGPFLVINTFHKSAFEFGIYQILIFGSYILGTRLVKPLLEKYQDKHLINGGLMTALIGGLLSTITWLYPHNLLVMIGSLMLVAGGTGFASPLLNRTAIEASREPMGARMALYSFLMSIFGMLSSAVISAIYNNTLISLAIVLVIFSIGGNLLGFRPKSSFKL